MGKAECALPSKGSSQSPTRQDSSKNPAELKNEISRYKRLIDDIPGPNCGRIKELKDAIKNGTYLTKEAILETAERIAARFLGRE